MKTIDPIFEDAIPVVLASDEGFAKFLGVTIQSILENRGNAHHYDLIVLDGGILDESRQKLLSQVEGLQNISLRFYDIYGELKYVDRSLFYESRHVTAASYFPIFIPHVLAEYEKCINLDCDLVVNYDLSELYEQPLNGHMVAAVRDLGVSSSVKAGHKKLTAYVFKTLQMDNAEDYFNAGVMLMNLKRMRVEQVEKRLLERLAQIKVPRHYDQSIFNSVLNGDVGFLDFRHNFMWSFGGEGKESYPIEMQPFFDNPGIIHYTSILKPWNCKSKQLGEYFWKYAEQTPFYDEIESCYKEMLKDNQRRNERKYKEYKWMCRLTLGLNKRLKEKKRDYYQRLTIR